MQKETQSHTVIQTEGAFSQNNLFIIPNASRNLFYFNSKYIVFRLLSNTCCGQWLLLKNVY